MLIVWLSRNFPQSRCRKENRRVHTFHYPFRIPRWMESVWRVVHVPSENQILQETVSRQIIGIYTSQFQSPTHSLVFGLYMKATPQRNQGRKLFWTIVLVVKSKKYMKMYLYIEEKRAPYFNASILLPMNVLQKVYRRVGNAMPPIACSSRIRMTMGQRQKEAGNTTMCAWLCCRRFANCGEMPGEKIGRLSSLSLLVCYDTTMYTLQMLQYFIVSNNTRIRNCNIKGGAGSCIDTSWGHLEIRFWKYLKICTRNLKLSRPKNWAFASYSCRRHDQSLPLKPRYQTEYHCL